MTLPIDQVVRGRRLAHGTGRRVRRMAGLSLREMAQAVEVDPATLLRWERGTSPPRPAHALRWLEVVEQLRRALDDEQVAG